MRVFIRRLQRHTMYVCCELVDISYPESCAVVFMAINVFVLCVYELGEGVVLRVCELDDS